VPDAHKEVNRSQQKYNSAFQSVLNLTNYTVGGSRDMYAFFRSTMRFTRDFLFLREDCAQLLEKVIKVSSSDGYTKEHIIT